MKIIKAYKSIIIEHYKYNVYDYAFYDNNDVLNTFSKYIVFILLNIISIPYFTILIPLVPFLMLMFKDVD